MDVNQIVQRAEQCYLQGRILEAQHLYTQVSAVLQEGINTGGAEQRRLYRKHLEIAQQLDNTMRSSIGKSSRVRTIQIENDSMGHSYKNLFGPYLTKDVKEIIIEETYLRQNHQFRNLINFMELAVMQCPNLEYVGVTTVQDDKKPENQTKALYEVRAALARAGIRFDFRMANFHDRRIVLDTGYIFHLGVGMDIYKPLTGQFDLGMSEFNFRRCKKTNVWIDQTEAFVEDQDCKCCIL